MPPTLARSLLAAALALHAAAAMAAGSASDLSELSLGELMNIEISSVSKRLEPLSDAAAAITVLTSEQLSASGARNIAEVLRSVPGMQVARSDANGYAVSVRGFNSTTADKLEVRLDGRSVYSPLFSGVFWDVLETDLDDVERIEIIRGPGATLYGANAVNGVINITTKSALATPGGHARWRAGNEERSALALRQSIKIGSGAVRANALARWRDDSRLGSGSGSEAADGSRFTQLSLRGDWPTIAGGSLSTGANIYDARFQSATTPTAASGQSAEARWARPGERGEQSLQLAYEHSERRIPNTYSERRNSASADYEQQRSVGERQRWVYGLGFHYSQDDTGGPPNIIIFNPEARTLNTYSAFVQDQIQLGSASALTLGSKFEHNDVSGFEIQPSIRIGSRLAPEIFVWGSVSRAVRTPNRLDQDIAIFCPPPGGIPGLCGPGSFRIGNPQLKSETLIATEAGLRLALARGLSADLAVFHNDYQKLKSTEPTPPFGAFGNRLKGMGDGGELLLNWQASAALGLRVSYSLLSLRIRPEAGSGDGSSAAVINGSSPRHQGYAALDWRFAPNWQWHANVRYLSRLSAQQIADRAELGLRLAWSATPRISLALSAENLLHDQQAEFGSTLSSRSELQRSAWLSLTGTWP